MRVLYMVGDTHCYIECTTYYNQEAHILYKQFLRGTMKLAQTTTHTLAIFAGGSLGTLVRCCVCLSVGLGFSSPFVILFINIIGSWVLGFVQTFLPAKHPLAQTFWGTGFCGAFTTYATFIGIVAVGMPSVAYAVGYALVSLIAGIMCATHGRYMGKRLSTCMVGCSLDKSLQNSKTCEHSQINSSAQKDRCAE